MCGIAGLIHKDKSVNIGAELQSMLQALKHRGPDSTGYAFYGEVLTDRILSCDLKLVKMLEKVVHL